MRILINAVSAHMGGSITYLQNLLPVLNQIAPQDRFYVFVPQATRSHLQEFSNIQLCKYPYQSTAGIRRLFFDQWMIPQILHQGNIDILFSSTGFGSFVVPSKQVLLVRNMAYFDTQFQKLARELGHSLKTNTLRRWHAILSMIRSNFIIFPTKAMQDAVNRYISLGDSKVKSLHYGYKRKSKSVTNPLLNAQLQAIDQWKRAGYWILLNISTYAIHKNFETIFEALSQLARQNLKVKLVTTTSREKTSDKTEYDQLKYKASALNVQQDWLELGYIPNSILHPLYEIADLYLFPSITESFGHSLVEAMAAGLPVIASDTAVNKEVCGDAGTYFAPFDFKECADIIQNLLSNNSEYDKKIKQSELRATHFSWHNYGRELMEIFYTING